LTSNVLKSRFVRFLLVLSVLAIAGLSTRAPASAAPAVPAGPVVVRVYYGVRENLDTLANTLDIWEVNHDQAYLVALVSPDRYMQLNQAGYRLEIDPIRTAQLTQPRQPLPGQGVDTIPGYPCYRTVEETYTSMQSLALNHPNLATWIDIGDSWDKLMGGGPAGYDLYALELTNKTKPGPKPTFFLMAEIHAREYVTSETAARFAEYLVSNYGLDPDITWLLDYYHVYIVPMTNPDGRKLAEAGDWWRKNTDSDDGCSDSSSWGTDLNRNSSFRWNMGGSSGDPCYDTYHGPVAGSEPEVNAFQGFVTTLFPDQRGPGDTDPAPVDTTGVFITLHSYSQLVLWPWGWSATHSPNHTQLQTLGRKLAYFNSYTPQQAYQLYQTSGTSDDWAYGTLGIAAYTFEMGTEFFQSCSTFESTIYPNNRNALMYAFKAARHPYMDPLGPESLSVTATPASVQPGTPVTLEATANDTRYRNGYGEPTQNIAAAHYTIDDPAWITGTVPSAMAAKDGNFNSKTEVARATLETSCLTPGRHTLFVESQDVNNNWGVPGAVFLTVGEAHAVSVSPVAAAQDAVPGQTVTYPLTVANLGNVADTFTVTLSSGWTAAAPAEIAGLAGCDQALLAVTVTVPVTAAAGALDIASLEFASSHPSVAPVTVTLTTTANPVFDLDVTVDAAAQDGFPGMPVTYTVHITNAGNTTDTFDVQVTSLWGVSVAASTGQLASGESTALSVVVTVPALAPANTSDTATVTVTSQADPTRWQEVMLVTTARWNGVWIPIIMK